MLYRHTLVILVLFVGTLVPLQAEVFRWVDAQGQVHYGNRPPADVDAQTLKLPDSGGSAPVEDTDLATRQQRQQRLLDAFAHERAQRRKAEVSSQERRQRVATYCQNLQVLWKQLHHGGPVFDDTPEGRVYLSEAQRRERQARVQQAYGARCGGALP